MTLEQTIPLMISKDFKERGIAEYFQIKIRTEQNREFIRKWKANELPFIPCNSLEQSEMQLKAMELYEFTLRMIESQVDRHLQELCDSKGYDDVKSCVGYFNSTDETFQREARAMTVYRDHLYRTCYNIMDQCEKGEIDYRTVTLEYILSLIDPIEW